MKSQKTRGKGREERREDIEGKQVGKERRTDGRKGENKDEKTEAT